MVLAVLLVCIRSGLLLVTAVLLLAGTIGGFVLVVTVGLFGFTLHTVTGGADLALTAEAAAIPLFLWQSVFSSRTVAVP